MSEPVSDPNVEDVLASIRRLVSEDTQPAKPAVPHVVHSAEPAPREEAAEVSSHEAPGRFVLTPSLRVMEETGDDPEADEPGADASDERPEDVSGEDPENVDMTGTALLTPEMREDISVDHTSDVETDEAQPVENDETVATGDLTDGPVDVGLNDAEAQADCAGEHAPLHDEAPEPVDADIAEPDVLSEPSAAEDAGEPDSEMPSEPGKVVGQLPEFMRSASTKMESPVANHADPAVDTPAETEVPADGMTSDSADHSAEIPESDQAEDAGDAEEPDAVALEDTNADQKALREPELDPNSLGAKIAALEAVIGRHQDEWEPDGSDARDFIPQRDPPAMEWQDEVGEDAEPTPEPFRAADPMRDITPDEQIPADIGNTPDEAESVTAFPRAAHSPSSSHAETAATDRDDAASDPEDMFVDEAMLRDVVTEIVRQELQGTLGERITRNVRKLVRREIQRAFTARDLD